MYTYLLMITTYQPNDKLSVEDAEKNISAIDLHNPKQCIPVLVIGAQNGIDNLLRLRSSGF